MNSNNGVIAIEETVTSDYLPVNPLSVLARIKEVLTELGTNDLRIEDDRLDRLMWLLNTMKYGQLATIDLVEVWTDIFNREQEALE